MALLTNKKPFGGSSPRKRCHSSQGGNSDHQYLTIVLFLFLSCGQNVISVDPVPTATIQKGNIELFKDLNTPLHRAILEQADLDYITILLQSIDVNQPGNQSETALHLAAEQGNVEVVKILLAHQANVHAKNIQGRTPLHLAAYDGKPEIIQLLLDHNASIEAKDNQGQTPLHRAAVAERVEAVQRLVNHQANIAAIDLNGKRPYDLAELDAVKQLLATQQPSVMTDARRMSLTKLIFQCDYGNIGKRILNHLTTKEKGQLRQTYTEMGWNLLQQGALCLQLTPDKFSSFHPYLYPRLYPHIQDATGITFHPVPIDALVQNTSDLQSILKDPRFVAKGVIFKGNLENLQPICHLLPPTVESMEIATRIPSGKKVDLSPYQHLKAIKVRDNPASIVLPKGAIVLQTPSCEEPGATHKKVQPIIPPVDSNNDVFNSFIGVKKIPAGAVTIGWRIGAGGFGQVYRGSWGEHPVALKRIGFEDTEKGLVVGRYQWAEDLSWEVGRLSTLAHPNVAQFYGIYQDKKEDYTYLVMEFCGGGDLEKELKTKGATIPWSKRWQWALEMSEGLAYLHSQGIVHRDLKADNVLLDRHGRAKLVDLGVAQVDKLLEEKESGSVVAGVHALAFMAPENVNDAALSTKATDIYALGGILWQIATHGGILRSVGKIEDFLPEREPIPADCPQSFKELMLDCWQREPDKRPNAAELVRRLAALGAELNPGQHVLIKACQKVENVIHPRRKEGRSYIAPFVTNHRLEESIETYWTRIEAAQAKGEKAGDHPLELKETFKQFIEAPGPATLLLLGEAGLGKTLTTYQWGDQLLEQWWAHIHIGTPAPAYFPIFIRPEVRTWSHAGIKGAFQEVARKYNLPPRIAPLVFIDGYDELQLDAEPTNLVEHLGLLETEHFKLTVTCRPNTVEKSALESRFGFNGALTICHFLPFSLDQLLAYLQKELSWNEKVYHDYQKTLADAEAVRTILRNPFVLHLFRESWTTLSKRPLWELNRWQIYEAFIEHILQTNKSFLSKKIQKRLQGGHPNLFASYQAFMSEIAWQAFQQKDITLGWQEAKELSPWAQVKQYAEEEAKDEFAQRQAQQQKALSKTREAEQAQLGRRNLLNEKDYVQLTQNKVAQFETELPLQLRGKEKEKRYEYSHKSLFEYGMAKRLLLLQHSPDIVGEGIKLLNRRKIQEEPEALQFWQEGWKEPGNKSLIEPLFAIITRSKDVETIQQASANSATLLAKAQVAFSGRALQRVRLPGADLSGALLSHTSLVGAQLPRAILREAYLGNTDFRGANLSSVNFGQYPSLKCKKPVYCLSYNHAGTQLAVGLANGNIELYKQAEGAYGLLATLKGHRGDINSVAYRPDDQQLATGSSDHTVGLWDSSSQQLQKLLKGHSGVVNSVCYRPDGKQLASGSNDNTVGLWDPHRQQLLAQLKGHSGVVNSVCYRPDGKQLASGSSDNTVGLWDPASKLLLAQLKGHSGGVSSVCYRPDGLQLASGSDDNTVGLWDLSSQQLLAQLKCHSGGVRSVCYRPDGQQLASGSSDNTVGLWDPSSQQLQKLLKGHSSRVRSVCYRPDGLQLASGSSDKTVGLWDPPSQQLHKLLKGPNGRVLSVCYRPDGQQLASGSDDKTVSLWDPASQQLLAQLKGHSGGVMSVCYCPDGQHLASGSSDKTVGLWDPSSRQLHKLLKGHKDVVRSVCYRPDGQQLASGSGDNTVGLWDVQAKQLITRLKGHGKHVTSVTYRPDGQQLATGNLDNTVGLWDPATQQLLAQLKGHKGRVNSVCYRPDGQQLASGSSDKTVGLWDTNSFQLVSWLKGHNGWVRSVCYRPDGLQLASGSDDNTVGLWDTNSFQLVSWLKGHSEAVMSVCYRPDGQQLASGSEDQAIFVWARHDIAGSLQETWQLIHRFENTHSLAAPGALLQGATIFRSNRALLKEKGANDTEYPQGLKEEKISNPIKTPKK